jgi:hypothetical protein
VFFCVYLFIFSFIFIYSQVFYCPKHGAGDIRVLVGERGRGLFAVSLFKKGEPIDSCAFLFLTLRCCTGKIIAEGSGKLVSTPGCHHYEWFDKRVFVFDPPSVGNLAALVNTPVSM